ncbi:MAG: glycosyltransferase family 2 protein, partial [Acidobacteriota bacterium]
MGPITNFHDDGFDMQRPFDAAVVIATILRPTLKDALLSVFQQNFQGRVQILVGIDKAIGDRGVLESALAHRPSHQAVTVLDPGYSTSVRHGGLHPDRWGGVLHTVMGYLANSRFLAYLADDN